MMTICLIFWFLTISASVTAVSIYLIKKIDIDSRKQEQRKASVATTAAAGRIFGRQPDDGNSYEDYNILGFLMDAAYAEDDMEDSHNRSQEASRLKPGKHRRTSTTPGTSTDYDYVGDGFDGSGSDGDIEDTDPTYDTIDDYTSTEDPDGVRGGNYTEDPGVTGGDYTEDPGVSGGTATESDDMTTGS